MFIQDLKHDFYNVLRGKRILVIVNYDIDAICAIKILQTLFRYDHMVYSIVPIMGIAGLRRAYEDNKEDVKNVLLINCGICIDLVELLQPDEDVTFFVCDAHRPMDVCNVYSDSQVGNAFFKFFFCFQNLKENLISQIKIFDQPGNDEQIPAFEALFRDDDSENERNDDDDEDNSDKENGESSNRHDRIERDIMKRREIRQWEENRNKIMFDYTQYR